MLFTELEENGKKEMRLQYADISHLLQLERVTRTCNWALVRSSEQLGSSGRRAISNLHISYGKSFEPHKYIIIFKVGKYK